MADAAGMEAELRKTELLEKINVLQHRITNMKDPADKVKSLQRGVITAEKRLKAAATTDGENKVAEELAISNHKEALLALDKATSAYAALSWIWRQRRTI